MIDVKSTSKGFYNDTNILEVFESSKSIDIFNDAILKIINDKYCLDEDLKAYLNDVNLKDKRYSNLVYLGDENIIWYDLKNIIEKTHGIDRIKKVQRNVFQYLKYNDDEIKSKSIIKTPQNKLVIPMIEMIDNYDSSFWENPYHKVLDPCGGFGNILLLVIEKFMDGLSGKIIGEEERLKWIINNCIYYGDINIKNCFGWLTSIDVNSEYNPNIFWGDFLSDGFEKHMQGVWDIEGFDLVIQDPPFKKVKEKSQHYSDYYDKFIEKSQSMSRLTVSTSPIRWFSKSNNSAFRRKMINDFGLKIINTIKSDDVYDNFKLRGGVNYSLIDKSSIKNSKVMVDGEYINLSKYEIIPNDTSELAFSIIDKVIDKKNINYRLNSSLHFGIKTNDQRLYKSGQYKCHVSKVKGNIKYISGIDLRLKKVDKWKLLIPNTTNSGGMRKEWYNRMIIAKPGELCSQSFSFFDFNTEEELLIFKKYLESDIVSYLVRLRKVKQHVNLEIFKWVPDININKIIESGITPTEDYFRDELGIDKTLDLTIK
jgi:hypothetical protein